MLLNKEIPPEVRNYNSVKVIIARVLHPFIVYYERSVGDRFEVVPFTKYTITLDKKTLKERILNGRKRGVDVSYDEYLLTHYYGEVEEYRSCHKI